MAAIAFDRRGDWSPAQRQHTTEIYVDLDGVEHEVAYPTDGNAALKPQFASSDEQRAARPSLERRAEILVGPWSDPAYGELGAQVETMARGLAAMCRDRTISRDDARHLLCLRASQRGINLSSRLADQLLLRGA